MSIITAGKMKAIEEVKRITRPYWGRNDGGHDVRHLEEVYENTLKHETWIVDKVGRHGFFGILLGVLVHDAFCWLDRDTHDKLAASWLDENRTDFKQMGWLECEINIAIKALLSSRTDKTKRQGESLEGIILGALDTLEVGNWERMMERSRETSRGFMKKDGTINNFSGEELEKELTRMAAKHMLEKYATGGYWEPSGYYLELTGLDETWVKRMREKFTILANEELRKLH